MMFFFIFSIYVAQILHDLQIYVCVCVGVRIYD